MHNKKWKFGIGIGIILAVVAWEGISGFQENKTYYVTVNELTQAQASRRHIRVGGIVAQGTIEHRGGQLSFRLAQDARSIPVTYVGNDTLPDTFKDGAQAIVDGDYLANGEFRADKIQAKCASKYSAAPLKGSEHEGPGGRAERCRISFRPFHLRPAVASISRRTAPQEELGSIYE
jgi:cytochrome c-type biogenesis protein CcmE